MSPVTTELVQGRGTSPFDAKKRARLCIDGSMVFQRVSFSKTEHPKRRNSTGWSYCYLQSHHANHFSPCVVVSPHNLSGRSEVTRPQAQVASNSERAHIQGRSILNQDGGDMLSTHCHSDMQGVKVIGSILRQVGVRKSQCYVSLE